jgi:hypothetical protein
MIATLELWRALGALTGPPSPERERLAGVLELGPLPDAAGHTELFVLQLPPYASIYLGPEGMLGGEARDRIAGFWRAVGRTPPAEPDHLAVLLGLYGSLVEEEGTGAEEAGGDSGSAPSGALARHARTTLLREHLVPWVFPYLLKVEEVGGSFHRGWAALLRHGLEEEVRGLEEATGDPDSAAPLPAHLAEAPSEPPDSLTDQLLTPVRSGLILTRADLARTSRERGLPLRIGERRYALRNMLQAAPAETVTWLRGEADGWLERHGRWAAAGGPAASYWTDRALATREALARLEEEASRETGPVGDSDPTHRSYQEEA